MKFSLMPLCLLLINSVAWADWQSVPEESEINFISIKKGSVAETHRFDAFSLSFSETGKAKLTIDLSSVNTGIDIRNERMKEVLFEVAQYPSATFTAEVDDVKMSELMIGDRIQRNVEGQFTMHGKTVPMTMTLKAVKLAGGDVLVTTVAPAIIDAKNFDLVNGILKLQELAGLPSIASAIPVTFEILMRKQ
ncbi:YceI family protein [Echinimonas agarilytica]|uniref:YceI family protein n=1 Tax=Echinimonas agarilytica TaxID=1215918 RepID=A0AA41W4P7_9GAMM|nr:YceI family protein [Echinimonas agarilytica]MCM2678904.1 YceI family protein [Echinimonas agarilytica]